MRVLFITTSAVGALLAAGCASTAGAPAPATQASAEQRWVRVSDPAYTPGDLDQVVCIKEHVVGSNRPKRRCATRLQWRQWAQDSQEKLEELDSLAKPASSNGMGTPIRP